MNAQPERSDLDDVLDAYMASAQDPNHATLAEWIRRYPQYQRELTEFAVGWSVIKQLSAAQERTGPSEETLVLRGTSVVQNLLHQSERQENAGNVAPLESVLAVGKASGLTPVALAQTLGLIDRRGAAGKSRKGASPATTTGFVVDPCSGGAPAAACPSGGDAT